MERHCTGGRPLSFGARPWCDVRAVTSNAQPAFSWHANERHCGVCLSGGGKTRELAARAPCCAGCDRATHYGRALHRREASLFRCKTVVRHESCRLGSTPCWQWSMRTTAWCSPVITSTSIRASARDPHTWIFDPLVVIAIGVWGTVPHLMIAALTALGLSVAAANAALGAVLEFIAHSSKLISRLGHSSPTRWYGV